jgi:hypothetical protein
VSNGRKISLPTVQAHGQPRAFTVRAGGVERDQVCGETEEGKEGGEEMRKIIFFSIWFAGCAVPYLMPFKIDTSFVMAWGYIVGLVALRVSGIND